MSATVGTTFGALLLGSLVACSLSGVVFVQSIVYFMVYPKDPTSTKAIVSAIWSLDTLHTCLVMASMWAYLIPHFGNFPIIDHIPWTLASTIAVTAVLTFIVHCFLAQRIHMLLSRDWRVTGPIVVLVVLRLVAATVTTGAMIVIKTFSGYSRHFSWVFTTGLGLSSTVDVVITITLCYNLRTGRTGTVGVNRIIDSLVLYTLETGALTSVAAILSMICWLAMKDNRIFLALHFVIAKIYANSLLATLNMRITLRPANDSVFLDQSHVILPSRGFVGASQQIIDSQFNGSFTTDDRETRKLEINVQQTIERVDI